MENGDLHSEDTRQEKIYTKEEGVHQHNAPHTKELYDEKRKYGCHECKYTTKLKNSLTRHLDAVHNLGEKRFKCDICPYSAAQGKYVRFHMASVHNIGEKFKCDKCPYSTPDKSTLKKHQGSKGCKGFLYKQMNINN